MIFKSVLKDTAELRQNFSEIWFPTTFNITTCNKYADRGWMWCVHFMPPI